MGAPATFLAASNIPTPAVDTAVDDESEPESDEGLDSKMPSLYELFYSAISNAVGNECTSIKLSKVINTDRAALEALSVLLEQAKADVDGLVMELGWEEVTQRGM
jgi:hypothetical protein